MRAAASSRARLASPSKSASTCATGSPCGARAARYSRTSRADRSAAGRGAYARTRSATSAWYASMVAGARSIRSSHALNRCTASKFGSGWTSGCCGVTGWSLTTRMGSGKDRRLVDLAREIVEIEGLGHERRASEREHGDERAHADVGRGDDHRDLRIDLAHPAHDLDAIGVGESQVEHDHFG